MRIPTSLHCFDVFPTIRPNLRYGIGRFTTETEVDRAVEMTVQHVSKLREMSPLWEMVQEGIDIKTIQWAQH